ncbi:MAG TPA: MAPEG family protein [Caulobacteraceae bacterium]|jgi:glutathione S-transferase|nr:MAPEG family protein [Caulobacteraceae bacterium]
MDVHPPVAIVSLLALLLYFYMSLRVGQGRGKYGIEAPAVTGHPDFERDYRIHMNTLEWLPLFLVSLWLFALSWGSDLIAAGIGAVWILGRILYLNGYSRAAAARGPGFGIQALATGVLLFGALGKIIWMLVQPGR